MQIPLPEHLRQLRDDQRAQRISPLGWRLGVAAMMGIFRYPALYRVAASLARPLLGWLSAHPGLMKKLPILGGWAQGRSLPAPQSHTFLGQRRRQLSAGDQDNRG